MTTTYTQPYTYSQAVRMAENVALDELLDLFDAPEGSAVTILRPRSPRRHAFEGKVFKFAEGRYSYWYRYCAPKTGYTVDGSESLTWAHDAVYDFYNIGRVVRLARQVHS